MTLKMTAAALLIAAASFSAKADPPPVMHAKAFDGGDVVFDGSFYDYRDPVAQKSITLWVPPNVKAVRGVLFHGNPGFNGDTRPMTRDRALQEFAARFDFGIAGVHWFPGGQVRTQTGKVILEVFHDWAKFGVHPELANVPFIARGSSNAGVTAFGLLCVAPERMICITPNVGPSYGALPVPAETLGVPALMHIGPNDPFFQMGVKETAELFAYVRPLDPLWAWDAEQGKKHEIRHIDDVDMVYYETCIHLRLPVDADPKQGPVKLNALRRQDGWLADSSTWSGRRDGGTMIAPYAKYSGDAYRAVWLPNQETAVLYRAISSYNNPLTLTINDLKDVENPNASGTYLRSVGGNVLDPDTTIVLTCQPEKDLKFDKIEFCGATGKIGEALAGKPLQCPVKLDGARAAHAFVATATRADGSVVTSYPVHVIVRDPAISAKLDAQAKQYNDDRVPPDAATPLAKDVQPVPAIGSNAMLIANSISDKEEADLNLLADKLPACWSQTEQRDHTVITAAMDANHGKGAAEVTVQAVYSASGLYLNFLATYPAGTTPAADDGTDFHIARDSSTEIWAGTPREYRFSSAAYSLALSECQYQANFGTPEKPESTLRRTYPKPFTMFLPQTVSDEKARQDYGIVVKRYLVSDHQRAMTWFIPWAYVGRPGPMTKPPVGTRLGLVLGYNQTETKLRWPNGVDPWAHAVEKGPNPNPWGDLVIGK